MLELNDVAWYVMMVFVIVVCAAIGRLEQ